MHQAAYILAAFTFGSQILALLRDRLLAGEFGAGETLDIYYSAFRIPDVMFVLFASALSIYVLIPFITRHQQYSGEANTGRFLTSISNFFIVAYTLLAAIVFIYVPVMVPTIFPGINDTDLLVSVTRILLLQPLFLGISSLFGVVTQISHRFVLYALSPILYNLGIIIGIVLLYPVFGLEGLAYGVVLGALMHMAVQWPLVRKSTMRPTLSLYIRLADVVEVLRSSIPRALTLSLNQIVLLVLVSIAGMMAVGSVSVFQLAFNLQSVPLAVVGMSYSIAAFPTLSYLFTNGDMEKFRHHILIALRHIIFWSVPILVLCIVLRAQLVRVILGSGQFDWSDTRLTAAVFAVFIFSLGAQAVNLLLIRGFYAGNNTSTPLFISIFTAIATLSFAAIGNLFISSSANVSVFLSALLRVEDVVGTEVLFLALSYAAGLILQSLLLLLFMRIRFGLSLRSLYKESWQAGFAALVGGGAAYSALQFFVDGLNTGTFIGIFLQGLLAGIVGVAGVILGYTAVRSRTLIEVCDALERKIFKTDVIKEENSI